MECTRRRRDYQCRQPYVPLPELERQVETFLESLVIPEKLHRWALDRLERMAREGTDQKEARRASLEKALTSVASQLDNLTKLRVRDFLTDEEFVKQRQELERERLRLERSLEAADQASSWFEPARLVVAFSNRAAESFRAADLRAKRLILQVAGSNLMLKDRKLSIEAAKPFRSWSRTPSRSDLWAA